MTSYLITVFFNGKVTGSGWHSKQKLAEIYMFKKLLKMKVHPTDIKQVKLFIFRKKDTLNTMKKDNIKQKFIDKYYEYIDKILSETKKYLKKKMIK